MSRIPPSRRARRIEPFRVMSLLEQARRLEDAGRKIIHLEIGEPDFPMPEPVRAAGLAALHAGHDHYTPAGGLPALREAIAEYYARRHRVHVDPQRVFVTPGASGALLLALALTTDPDDAVLLTDPGYPCNRHFAETLGVRPIPIPVGPQTDYQLTAEQIIVCQAPDLRAVLVASPANPTGSVLDRQQITNLQAACTTRELWLLVDEIYQGLEYEAEPLPSALNMTNEALVINSFSKFFGMTGWRLGWLVVPDSLVEAAERLVQNLFIAASTPAQHAALAAFSPQTASILETRRQAFEERIVRMHERLTGLPLDAGKLPSGGFYLYARLAPQLPIDAETFSMMALEHGGLAITPGTDFGRHQAGRHLRFACTRPVDQLDEAADRLEKLFESLERGSL